MKKLLTIGLIAISTAFLFSGLLETELFIRSIPALLLLNN